MLYFIFNAVLCRAVMSHPPAIVVISHVHMLVQNTALLTLKLIPYYYIFVSVCVVA